MAEEETLVGDQLVPKSAGDATARISTVAQNRLHGRWLTLARVVWFVIAATAIMSFAANIPPTFNLFRTPCAGDQCIYPQLPPGIAQAAGISMELYAGVIVVTQSLPQLIFVIVGIIIFWRRSDDLSALLGSAALLTFGASNILTNTGSGLLPTTALQMVDALVSYVGGVAFPVFLLTFPDGRFALRWTRWLALAVAINQLNSFFPNAPIFNGPVGLALFIPLVGLVLFAVVQRYRRVSNRVQRQQTKWVVFGVVTGFVSFIAFLLVGNFLFSAGTSNSESNFLLNIFINPLPGLFLALIPVSIAFSILRTRLWDIDFVINRTLVYGALSVMLIALFGIALFIISQVFQNFAGGPLVAVAISALIFGLIFPAVRVRLQRFVDRRLYGIKINYQRPLPSLPQNSAAVASVATPDNTVKRQFGAFEVLEPIGHGGMAEVYKGRHTTLGKTVAIKTLPSNLVQDADFRKRFEREARTVASLKHPNIVEVFDFGEADGVPYMVMEYIAGQDLADYLHANGRLPLLQALPLIQDIANALDYAHGQGVVHRDIKASNVMLEPVTSTGHQKPYRAVLMDFGIAKIVGSGTRLTQGGMMGTLEYIAPEQIQDSADVDARADIYALGVLVYQMLTGLFPFQNSNPGALLMSHLQQPLPDPRRTVPELSNATASAVQCSLAKSPAERFPSAGAFVAALA